MHTSRKLVSILIPAYNEEGNIPSVIERLSAQAVHLSHLYDFEFLVMDNSSQDRTRELVLAQCKNDTRWKYLRYSRNFGAEASVLAGLDNVMGDAAIMMFSDLQDPPENIPVMLQKWREGADVVYGVVNERNDKNFLKTIGAKIAYFMIHHLTESKIPSNATDFRLLDRKVIEALKTLREPDRYFRGLVHWVGFKQVPFSYDRHKRVAGNSNANIVYCIKFALHAIVCFSSKPMHLSMFFGMAMTGLSFFAALTYFALYFAKPTFLQPPPPGITTIILLGIFIVGMNSMFLGIIGEYVGRIYRQGKNRPLYIIAEKFNFQY